MRGRQNVWRTGKEPQKLEICSSYHENQKLSKFLKNLQIFDENAILRKLEKIHTGIFCNYKCLMGWSHPRQENFAILASQNYYKHYFSTSLKRLISSLLPLYKKSTNITSS